MVRALVCHTRGRGFELRRSRQMRVSSNGKTAAFQAVNASSILVTRWLANFRNLHVVQAVSTNSENIRRHRLTVRTLLLQSRKRSSTLRVARDA